MEPAMLWTILSVHGCGRFLKFSRTIPTFGVPETQLLSKPKRTSHIVMRVTHTHGSRT